MTPFFNPGSNPYGAPKVYLAAVGERMTEVAGEVADGMLVHGFTTERYLREVTLPALERGLKKSGRSLGDFSLSYPAFIVTGRSDEEIEKAAAGVRQQIAFYGSTPAYQGVLDIHGWGALQPELNSLSKQGEWKQMGELITDDILETFAIVAPPEDVPRIANERVGDVVDRFSFYMPYSPDPEQLKTLLRGFKS
jgi:probable F420-dependent oxidoreductase